MKNGRAETVKSQASEIGVRPRNIHKAIFLSLVLFPLILINGCAGVVTKSSGTVPSASFTLSPGSVNFGSVAAGQKTSQTVTVTNTGNVAITIQSVTFSNTQFSLTGATFPMSLAVGQNASATVWFTGATAGSTSGTLTVQGTSGTSPFVVSLSGTVTSSQPKLSLSTDTVNFGTISIGTKGTANLTVTNAGTADLTISLIAMGGAEFGVSGITTPKTISAGQSVPVTASFSPTATGSASGSISFTSNDPTNGTSVVTLNGTGSSTASGQLTANPSTISFGSIAAGSNSSQQINLTNTGNASVQISSISASGAGFSVSGLTTPATLTPSQTATLSVKFAPTAAGAASGTVTVTSNATGSPLTIALSGTGTQAGVSISPASFNFGSIVDGQTKSQSFTVTNNGAASLTISQITVSGAGYSVSGLNTPATVAAGQSTSFSAVFAPTTAGSLSGNVSIASNAPNSPTAVALSGTGVAATVALSASPTSVSFASVNAGSTGSQSVTLTNTGNSSLTISQITVNAKDFAASGITTPLTLAVGKTAALNVAFSPASSENVTGNITVTTSQGANAVIPVSGTGVQAALTVTPASVNFGSVTVGSANSQTIQLTNSGSAVLTITQLSAAGTGFTMGAVSLPLSINPGKSSTFNAQFSPASAGSASGSISVVSNAPNSPATIVLSGSGVAATHTLSFSTASLSFGNVNTGTSVSQSVTVTNTGNASVTISQITVNGSGFSLSGAGTPVTLTPTQTLTFSVLFDPTIAGGVSGSVSVVSNATGSPTAISLSGTGLAATPHTVALTWNASTSTVSGYNVYRSTISGSGYGKINGGLVGSLSYTDSAVQNGITYYYVTTAVDGSGNESTYSNEAQAIVP